MKKDPLISPSILSADFGRLLEEVKSVEAGGADALHLDMMDGHFVPNLTFGSLVAMALRGRTLLPMHAHLMVTNPRDLIVPLAEASVDTFIFHAEVCRNQEELVREIRSHGMKAGISVNPKTPLTAIDESVLPLLDQVLIMTVEPGFGGQSFIWETLPKVSEMARIVGERGLNLQVSVDGGVNMKTAKDVYDAGAWLLVAGSAVFGAEDRAKAIRDLREAALGTWKRKVRV
jgi:ribulose-phosphate 3-epimerase